SSVDRSEIITGHNQQPNLAPHASIACAFDSTPFGLDTPHSPVASLYKLRTSSVDDHPKLSSPKYRQTSSAVQSTIGIKIKDSELAASSAILYPRRCFSIEDAREVDSAVLVPTTLIDGLISVNLAFEGFILSLSVHHRPLPLLSGKKYPLPSVNTK